MFHDFRRARSPVIVRLRDGDRYWFDGGTVGDSVDDVLRRVGLTRHDPKPETAEERVRAAVDMSEPPLQADLRATLAELDRARAELTRARGAVESSERIRCAFYAELTELRAQRPVDVEAVLAPIRTVSDSYAHQIASHENESDRRARAEQFNDALWHHTRGVGLGLARNELIRALAEAEKIGRGQ